METFVESRDFVPDRHFEVDREKALRQLSLSEIDRPIIDLIQAFTNMTWCFTLQCCWGHFVHEGQPDSHGCEPLANYGEDSRIRFQLAYVAVRLKNSSQGRALHDHLRGIVSLDPSNIQFGCAEWFWKQQVNSYVVQMEPDRFKNHDRATIGVKEAMYLQTLRSQMFERLRAVADKHALSCSS